MASFNGIDLGLILRCNTVLAEKDRQINAYPGVDGLEILDLGNRGAVTNLRALISGVDVAGLAAVKRVFYELQYDGGAYTFVDHEFTVWSSVMLVKFEPIDQRYLLVGDMGICQVYEAVFEHTGN